MKQVKKSVESIKQDLEGSISMIKQGKDPEEIRIELETTILPKYFREIKSFFIEVDNIEEQSEEMFNFYRELEEKIDDISDKLFNSLKSKINLLDLQNIVDELGKIINRINN